MTGENVLLSNVRLRHAAVAFALAVLIGVSGFVGPLNGLLWATQARIIQHPASGDIVYVGAEGDIASPANVGARAELAETVDRLSALGASRIFIDIPFERPGAPTEDRLLNEAALRSGVTTFVDRYSTRGAGESLIASTPSVAQGLPSVVRKEWVGLLGYTWTASYSVTVGGKTYPSFPAALAGTRKAGDESFHIDYFSSYSSIPAFTMAQVSGLSAESPEARTFAGKAVVVGALPGDGVNSAAIPGFLNVPESYVGIYAAEALKHGPIPTIGWYVPVILVALLLGIACLLRRSSVKRFGYFTAVAALPALFAASLWIGFAIELFEALALIAIYGGIRSWYRLYRRAPLFDNVSGLPTFEKFEQDLRGGRLVGKTALIAAKIHRFDEVLASLPREKHRSYMRLIAERLKLADENMTIYTSGGRYFAWVQDYESSEQLRVHLKGMRAIFASSLNVDDVPVDVGITFGVDTGDADDPAKRISSALAVVDKTSESQNAVIVADRASDEDRLWNISLQARLDEAMKTGEIYVVYQPQFDLETGRLYGAEALARWHDPERGDISPSYFIEQCEQVGRMDALTRKVFDEALAAVSDSPFVSTDFNLSMNVSATMLGDFEIVRILDESLGRSRMKPGNVTIEMTETARIADLRQASVVMSELKTRGVRLSADDFGVGAASFEPFLELPFDELKIDRLFVAQIVRDAKARRIVEHLVKLGKDLDIRVLAEGVEDQATLEILKSLGCPAAQGFKLGRPVSLVEVYRSFGVSGEEGEQSVRQASTR